MYAIELADGTRLENLELNGNNFIAPTTIEDSVFEGNLGTVTITGEETTETCTDMVLEQNQVVDGKSWFILREQTVQEKTLDALKSIVAANRLQTDLAMAEIVEMMTGGQTV